MMNNPAFTVKLAHDVQSYFTLTARNGEVILMSELYTTKAACFNGVESVKTHALDEDVGVSGSSTDYFSGNLNSHCMKPIKMLCVLLFVLLSCYSYGQYAAPVMEFENCSPNEVCSDEVRELVPFMFLRANTDLSTLFYSSTHEYDPNDPNQVTPPYGVTILSEFGGLPDSTSPFVRVVLFNNTDTPQVVEVCFTVYYSIGDPDNLRVYVPGTEQFYSTEGNGWTNEGAIRCCNFTVKPKQRLPTSIIGPTKLCGDGPWEFCSVNLPAHEFFWSISPGYKVQDGTGTSEDCIKIERDGRAPGSTFQIQVQAPLHQLSEYCPDGHDRVSEIFDFQDGGVDIVGSSFENCDGSCVYEFSVRDGEASQVDIPQGATYNEHEGTYRVYDLPCTGTEDLTITDDQGCSSTFSIDMSTHAVFDIETFLTDRTVVTINEESSTPCLHLVSISNPHEDLSRGTWIWKDDNGNLVSTDTENESLAPGNYELEITTPNGCVITKQIEVPDCNITVEDDDIDFTLYPNPHPHSTHYVNMDLDLLEGVNITVEVVDNQSNVLHTENLGYYSAGQYDITINHGALQAGTYQVRGLGIINGSTIIHSEQMVVQ